MTARADRLERGRQVLRLQGRADAVVILVATKFRPGLTLEDYARVLDVPAAEVQAALARRRGPRPEVKPPPKRRPPRSTGPHVCPEPGCDAVYDDRRGLASHRMAAHSDPVPCPKGCGRMINPRGLGPHTKNCQGPADD